jgi:hypothetical protein
MAVSPTKSLVVCHYYICTAAWELAHSRYTVFLGWVDLGRKKDESADRTGGE